MKSQTGPKVKDADFADSRDKRSRLRRFCAGGAGDVFLRASHFRDVRFTGSNISGIHLLCYRRWRLRLPSVGSEWSRPHRVGQLSARLLGQGSHGPTNIQSDASESAFAIPLIGK